ncbi:MAG: hypothetical protein D3M94_07320 [Rhodocyclales bacterium GT-UBC]|nr:MAG: hypothetical protein D3M94_07320 [Rhodocyclales bacterium GT-UBC]
MKACLDHAMTKHRRSVDHIAADMGLANPWNLYKWVESGRIPAVLIRPFELACRCNYVTSYLAHAAHRLIIDIPTGRMPTSSDLPAVQAATHDAMGALINFAAGKAKAEEVMTAVTTAMEQLAYHRENAARAAQPELELDQPE